MDYCKHEVLISETKTTYSYSTGGGTTVEEFYRCQQCGDKFKATPVGVSAQQVRYVFTSRDEGVFE